MRKQDAVPRATLEMGAPPYAGWERRCIVCAHVREDHWLCVSPAAVHGLVGSTHKSAYVASKHGVVGFSKVVSGWAGVRGPCASYASPSSISQGLRSVCPCVCLCTRAASARPGDRWHGGHLQLHLPRYCVQALWRTLGGPVPSSLPTSLLFFYCVSTTPAG